jgi:hypothetical protein
VAPAPDEESGAGVVGGEEGGTPLSSNLLFLYVLTLDFLLARGKEETRPTS